MAALRTQVDETWQTARSAGLGLTVDVGASLLQQQIVAWRERAIEDGTQSVPGAMKRQLVGYFPESLLDRVRYRIGWSTSYSLQSGLFRIFSPKAVALVDVIVFRDAALAADPVLWAHELAHVQQYDSWGASEFARGYVRDHSAVEGSAWNVAASYRMWALQKERRDGGATLRQPAFIDAKRQGKGGTACLLAPLHLGQISSAR